MNKFQCIVADNPWSFSDALSMSSVKRGADAHYSTMTTNDLCELPVKEIADPEGCVLALWVVGSMLEDGMRVMKAWGFEQKQVYCWIKNKKQKSINDIAFKDTISAIKKLKKDPNALQTVVKEMVKTSLRMGDWLLSFGMGRLFRSSAEICLIGINNTKIYQQLQNKSQRSVCFAENTGHSTKPENLQDSLELMFPTANKIEIFGRRERNGWTVIGNEVGKNEDILVSLNRMIDKE
jgi:N6-adenosine-specific RNA methylase IME4